MSYADEQAYEEVISQLQKLVNDGEEQCNALSSAGEDCVDNTDGDPAAEKCSEKLQSCVSNIRTALSEIEEVIQKLQAQLDTIREAAKQADDVD